MDFQPLLKLFSLDPLDAPLAIVAALLFYALYRILTAKLFNPYLAHIEAREAATEGALSQAGANVEEAKRLDDEFAAQIFAARVAANSVREGVMKKSEVEVARVVEEGTQAEERIVAVSAAMRAEAIEKTREILSNQSDHIVGNLTDRVRSALGVK